jgi:hypothetical protein
MKFPALRLLSPLALLLALLSWSGIATTAAALTHPEAQDACCPPAAGAGDEDNAGSDPCSAPDCPCFSCLTLAASGQIELCLQRPPMLAAFPPPPALPRAGFANAIEYPPEIG